ncbi:MAG: SH3 domain-containing protein [Oscillatoria sp. Prado101]|jgi:predicted secreted protein|nr:SH3 domain-containing protein [Oscillatoria sp. Prado101]
MKRAQIIVSVLAGLSTAVGVASATIQSKSPAPDTSSTTPANAPVEIAQSNPIVITPPTTGCKITQAKVADPNPPLNVRSSPQVANGNIVGKLNNGTFVSVAQEKNGWLQITDPVRGWVAKNRTESSCSQVSQRITFAPRGDSAIVRGQIIGGGSHSYIIRATKGQTMTVTVQKGALPFIFPPNDPYGRNDLSGGGHYSGKTNWTGKLPATGDYTLTLDSNFKGFEYEFLLRVK